MARPFDIPVGLKEQLLDLATRLPECARKEFLARSAQRLAGLAADHSHTLIIAAAGWVLGEVLDRLLTFHVPFLDIAFCLTGDRASTVGLATGAIAGLLLDRKRDGLRAEVAEIIGQELRRALAATGS